MNKKLTHGILSVILAFTLLMPTAVKFFDNAYHEHDHFACSANGDNHIHSHHESCPIQSFELFLYVFKIQEFVANTIWQPVAYTGFYTYAPVSDDSKFSFSLRAPPVNCEQ